MSVNFWIKYRNKPLIKQFVRRHILHLGVDLPNDVIIGKNVSFVHNSLGSVFTNNVVIHDNVKIFQNVTLGRKDVISNSSCGGIEVMNNSIICAGAKVLCGKEKITIGEGSIVAANAVLLNSTKPGEIWGGVPARLIGFRNDIKKEETKNV